MIRKVLTVSTAVALGLVVLPALPASAAPSAATLVAGAQVLPGDARGFAIDVRNTNSALIGGERINLVLVTLPSNVGIKTSTAPVQAPDGWTVTRTSAGSVQTYQFRTTTPTSTASIAPGATLRFPFPADVAPPVSTDRTGAFKVTASSDYGNTVDAATGALESTVKILEIVDGSLKATAPLGVADQSGTAGQGGISYQMTVRNYAQQPVAVTPTLSSPSDNVGAPTPVAPATVTPTTPTTFTFPVTLGGTTDRTSTFSAAASAPSATAAGRTAAFTVQRPADLTLDLASLQPRTVRKDRSYTFGLKATKTGAPNLTELTGSFTFGKTTTGLKSPTTIAGTAPVDLAYDSTTIDPTDADRAYDATLTFSGKDSNDYVFPTITKTLTNAITIDNAVPLPTVNLSLPSDPADGTRQTAAKNGDTINVSGSLDNGATNCTGLRFESLDLVTDNGQRTAITPSINGCNYSGSVTNTQFLAGAKSFDVQATVLDAALNSGFASSVTTLVDNVTPRFASARSLSPRQISVTFDENLGLVRGGCAPSQYRVDGELIITQVLFSNGDTCSTPSGLNTVGPDNTRILVLSADRDQDFQANVEYTPGRFPAADPVKDGANAASLAGRVLSEVGINPNAPSILTVTRNKGTETATFDEQKYFTRFPGEDLEISFANGRAGYTVQVLDGENNVIKTAPVGGSPSTVSIPVGSTDGTVARQLRLVNGQGLLSTTVPFSVELDRKLPEIGAATLRTTGNEIDVTFSEKLAAGGSESPINWFGKAVDPQGDPNDPDQRNRVSPATKVTGSGAARLITIADNFNGLEFAGAEYIFQAPQGTRYPDRAGNLLEDTTVNVG